MKFFVDQTGCRRHPLHVAGADTSSASRRIPVLDFTLINDGHGLEPAMRMRADTTTLARRRELRGAGIIKKQEGAKNRTQAGVCKKSLHGETIAYPMVASAALDAAEFLGRFSGVS